MSRFIRAREMRNETQPSVRCALERHQRHAATGGFTLNTNSRWSDLYMTLTDLVAQLFCMNSFGQELSFKQGSDFHVLLKPRDLSESEHKDQLQWVWTRLTPRAGEPEHSGNTQIPLRNQNRFQKRPQKICSSAWN